MANGATPPSALPPAWSSFADWMIPLTLATGTLQNVGAAFRPGQIRPADPMAPFLALSLIGQREESVRQRQEAQRQAFQRQVEEAAKALAAVGDLAGLQRLRSQYGEEYEKLGGIFGAYEDVGKYKQSELQYIQDVSGTPMPGVQGQPPSPGAQGPPPSPLTGLTPPEQLTAQAAPLSQPSLREAESITLTIPGGGGSLTIKPRERSVQRFLQQRMAQGIPYGQAIQELAHQAPGIVDRPTMTNAAMDHFASQMAQDQGPFIADPRQALRGLRQSFPGADVKALGEVMFSTYYNQELLALRGTNPDMGVVLDRLALERATKAFGTSQFVPDEIAKSTGRIPSIEQLTAQAAQQGDTRVLSFLRAEKVKDIEVETLTRGMTELKVPTRPTPQERGEAAGRGAQVEVAQRLVTTAEKHTDWFGGPFGVRGKYQQFLANLDKAPPGFTDFINDTNRLRAELVRALAGANIGPAEREVYFGTFPNPTSDSAQQFTTNAKATLENIQRLDRYITAVQRGENVLPPSVLTPAPMPPPQGERTLRGGEELESTLERLRKRYGIPQ